MKNKAFFKNFLLHSIAIWLLVNVADIFTYFTGYAERSDPPFIALHRRFVNHNYHQATWLLILVFCLLVEINYQYVFKKYRLATLKFVLLTVAASFLFMGLLHLYTFMFSNYISFSSLSPAPEIYLLYAGTYIFVRNHFEEGKLRAEQLQQKTTAELNALKAQLNPHFFFNTLNTIYGTALQENATRTAETIDRLSFLVRYVMEKTAQDLAPLAGEIKFIEDYFELQEQRLPARDNITITKEIHCDAPSQLIAPLLFLPFLENAFKYGISIDKPCFINLQFTVKNKRIEMKLSNAIIPGSPVKPGDGTGIANAKKRLQLLYPQAHALAVTNDENTFTVTLTINL